MKYGLIGEKLGHSFSPAIHKMFGNNDYELKSLAPDELEGFIKNGEYIGLNVTIPYKKAVIPFCDEISPRAKDIGSVNTLVRRHDGTLFGDNTDYLGFLHMAKKAGISLAGKKVVILGDGGTGIMARAAAKDQKAREVVTVSLYEGVRYEDRSCYLDAEILVNATPVGMFPNNGELLVHLEDFTHLEGVLDVIYNPLSTAFLLQAKKRKLPCSNGLPMLVEQARCAAELFQGHPIPPEKGEEVYRKMRADFSNLVIIDNMRLAERVAYVLKRKFLYDSFPEAMGKQNGVVIGAAYPSEMLNRDAVTKTGILISASEKSDKLQPNF
ncbi:MAG: shikimate dehydrogenase, partial [Bacillota bacterium]|nr:shikimate dehydrogenase [Bacillota bacterium]